MRLSDDLAATSFCYDRPLPTLPDILLIDVPARYASDSLPLGRFYPIMVETQAEWSELTSFLHRPRPALIAPDLLDRRPTACLSETILIARYAPPAPTWPWVLLCCWPAAHTALAPESDFFARQTYTVEVFWTLEALQTTERNLLETLDGREPLHVWAPPEAHGLA